MTRSAAPSPDRRCPHRASAETDSYVEMNAVQRSGAEQCPLCLECARERTVRCGSERGLAGPHRQNRISRKFEDVAAVSVYDVDQRSKEDVEQFLEIFGAAEPTTRQRFGDRGETGEIGQQQYGVELFETRRGDAGRRIRGPPPNQIGNERAKAGARQVIARR
jgi:hypothetical protein